MVYRLNGPWSIAIVRLPGRVPGYWNSWTCHSTKEGWATCGLATVDTAESQQLERIKHKCIVTIKKSNRHIFNFVTIGCYSYYSSGFFTRWIRAAIRLIRSPSTKCCIYSLLFIKPLRGAISGLRTTSFCLEAKQEPFRARTFSPLAMARCFGVFGQRPISITVTDLRTRGNK